MIQKFPGINIQFPISVEIMEGRKSIETRTYPIPEHYLNIWMAVIETPGKSGRFKARVVGAVKFSSCFKYPSKDVFYKDYKKHLVDAESPYAWTEKPKWGWVIESVRALGKHEPAPKKRGIVFTKAVKLKLNLRS